MSYYHLLRPNEIIFLLISYSFNCCFVSNRVVSLNNFYTPIYYKFLYFNLRSDFSAEVVNWNEYISIPTCHASILKSTIHPIYLRPDSLPPSCFVTFSANPSSIGCISTRRSYLKSPPLRGSSFFNRHCSEVFSCIIYLFRLPKSSFPSRLGLKTF